MEVKNIENLKVESKISILKDGVKQYVAEVVANCGCGFDYLIRIHPDYKHSLPIFAYCMYLCGIKDENINIDKNFVYGCYLREYVIGYENIAIVVDKII